MTKLLPLTEFGARMNASNFGVKVMVEIK